MSDDKALKPIRHKIVINFTSDGGNDLQNCFFMRAEVEGFYNFYNKHGETLATGLRADVPFPFLLGGLGWTINQLKIRQDPDIDRTVASGDWQNNAPGPPNADGTFQAESGGGVDPDEVVNDCTHPSNQIEIKTVSGGVDKDKLKHCYFVPAATSGQYDLYSKHCNLLASGLTSGTGFTFTHDSITWTVTDFVISDTAASGNWSNPDELTTDQNGTFQAESGGGAGEGEGAASAASA